MNRSRISRVFAATLLALAFAAAVTAATPPTSSCVNCRYDVRWSVSWERRSNSGDYQTLVFSGKARVAVGYSLDPRRQGMHITGSRAKPIGTSSGTARLSLAGPPPCQFSKTYQSPAAVEITAGITFPGGFVPRGSDPGTLNVLILPTRRGQLDAELTGCPQFTGERLGEVFAWAASVRGSSGMTLTFHGLDVDIDKAYKNRQKPPNLAFPLDRLCKGKSFVLIADERKPFPNGLGFDSTKARVEFTRLR